MKKILTAAFALTILSLSALSAQENPLFIAVQGGAAFSINENGSTYFDNDKALDLLKFQGAASVGYYYSPRYGVRLYGEYSQNASACNSQETMVGGFWPYTFNSGMVFADWIINGGDVSKPKAFNWRPYCGIGAAYSFGLKWGTETLHPFQARYIDPRLNVNSTIVDYMPAISFAFRYGMILEYVFDDVFGIFIDGSHEWFTDIYNGMAPKTSDGKTALGFPFDMKLNVSLGIALHI